MEVALLEDGLEVFAIEEEVWLVVRFVFLIGVFTNVSPAFPPVWVVGVALLGLTVDLVGGCWLVTLGLVVAVTTGF